jgi:beta-glucosidase
MSYLERALPLVAACGLVLSACGAPDKGGAASSNAKPEKAAEASVAWPSIQSEVARDPKIEARIVELLGKLTLEQKVAQMVQPDIRYVTPADVKKYRLGSILNGGGAWPHENKHSSVSDWVKLADQYYDAAMDTSGGGVAIPVIWGVDAVHGHNNVIGATLFPHNIGLGAAHDPELIERIGAATAAEVAATGIDWTFAPTVAVVRDDRWGRSYEGYSEDPEIVREYAGRMVHGLQGVPGQSSFLDNTRIIATAKHYLGDGGTLNGVDRGDNRATEQELLKLHAQGYLTALQAGAQTVMASYNSWQGVKLHGQQYLLTDVLKTKLGFDGLVVSDWDGVDEVQACAKDKCPVAVNAGIDVFMVPTEWKAFLENTVAQVRSGVIPQSRIDDAVSRILRVKTRFGLFEKGRPSSRSLAGKREVIGAPEHRAVAREAVRKSLVLLKNENKVLPLAAKANVLVAGTGADNIGKQAGGWTITWQGSGNQNSDFPGATSIYGGIKAAVAQAGGTATLSVDGQYQAKPDVAIVVFGEEPYAEWHGDIPSVDYSDAVRAEAIEAANPSPQSPPQPMPASLGAAGRGNTTLAVASDHGAQSIGDSAQSAQGENAAHATSAEADYALLRRFKEAGIPVVAVFLTGRPLAVSPAIDASDAFVVAWLPGSEGAGVADVLFRKADGSVNFDFVGKLSYSWPRTGEQTSVNRGDAQYDPLFPYGFGLTY